MNNEFKSYNIMWDEYLESIGWVSQQGRVEMSKLREAAQQMLETPEKTTTYTSSAYRSASMTDECNAAIAAGRAALAEQCQCGDRPAAECPGKWEPGCDLGANEAHAKVHEPQEPVAIKWTLDGDTECSYNNWLGETPFGRILITWKGWKAHHDACVDEFPGGFQAYGEPDEVKAACEAEFSRRHSATPQRQPQDDPVAKVELMMTGGNAGLATRIVEIDDHLRERLRPGQMLYTHPAPQRQPLTEEPVIDGYPLWSGMPQRPPLTEDEAWDMWEAVADRGKKGVHIVIDFARAIEDAVWEKINGNKT